MPDDTLSPATGPRDTAPLTPDQVGGDLKSAAETINQAAKDVGDEVAAEAADLKDVASRRLAEATDKAKGFAGERKDEAADQLGGVSAALSRVADELGGDTQTAAVAGYARDLASGIRQVSETVRNNSVDEVIGMVEDFGRRQPAAFLGAAALAGFVASRFVMASADRRAARPPASATKPAYDPDTSNAYGSTGRGGAGFEGSGNLANTTEGGAFK
jgi:hypothetical protein